MWCKLRVTCHSLVRWCAPCTSDTLLCPHHTPLTVRYIHRVDIGGNSRIPPGSDRTVDQLPLNDTHTDLWPDRTALTPSHEGHTRTLQKSEEKRNHSRITLLRFILLHHFRSWESFLRLQPSGPKPNVSGAQLSQQRPITLGLHSQIPPSLLQDGPREPTTLHLQAEEDISDIGSRFYKMHLGEVLQTPDRSLCARNSSQ